MGLVRVMQEPGEIDPLNLLRSKIVVLVKKQNEMAKFCWMIRPLKLYVEGVEHLLRDSGKLGRTCTYTRHR